MKRLMALLAVVVGFSGCGGVADYMLMRSSADLPGPMQSSLALQTSGKADLEYDILGMGEGESTGWIFAVGVFSKDANIGQAYKDAVNSLGGDFLINANKQVTKAGFVAPIVFGIYTVKVTGLVAKIRKK